MSLRLSLSSKLSGLLASSLTTTKADPAARPSSGE